MIEATRCATAEPQQAFCARGEQQRDLLDDQSLLPLLPFAEAQWYFNRLEPDSPAFHLPFNVRLMGKLNVTALEQSLNEVIRRHQALRAVFDDVDDQPVQTITPWQPQELRIVDLSHLPASQREAEARRLALEEARRPFDLKRGRLFRFVLLRLESEHHILLRTIHHIISDGWSVAVLVREIAALYEAFCAEQPSPLKELDFNYADFVRRQCQRIDTQAIEPQSPYWKEQLARAFPVLALPTDRPATARQLHRAGKQTLALDADLTNDLRAVSCEANATLFMTLLAAFNVLLYRNTRQVDIAVACPIANRNSTSTRHLVGPLLNTLVLRNDLSGNPTFLELLDRVRTTALSAYAQSDVPFEKLIEKFHPSRTSSRERLLQVMIRLLPPTDTHHWYGLVDEPFDVDGGGTSTDLTLQVVPQDEGVLGHFEYRADLFEATVIERMRTKFRILLEGVTADPNQRIAELPILTAAQRNRLLIQWNETARQSSYENKCLHELLEAQVLRTPDAVAAVYEDQQITYAQLNDRANRVAHYLRGLGIGRETLVGICIERSLEMVVGVLGILKAGGAYVPLDPAFPQQRLEQTLADSSVPVVLTEQSVINLLPNETARLVCLDADWQIISHYSAENVASDIRPDNLAYVIYTSGSTGIPKGVQVCHRNLTNFLDAMRREPGLTADDTLLSVTTLSFDISVLELFLPLTTGARLVVVSRDVAVDGQRLMQTLHASRVTVMQATPATWKMLIDAGWTGSGQLRILCGGETLPGQLAEQLLGRCACLWNLYGPTETTIWSTLYEVRSASRRIPIGRPIANTQVYVLDEHRQPVPEGVPGELYIGGDGVARGYRNRPELTAEKFVRNPFVHQESTEDSALCLYRTGDLVCYRADGNLEFLGRIDHQVKIRGFRVELGEIETALCQHPAIEQAAAAVVETDACDAHLTAFIVTRHREPPASQDLLRYLGQTLPEYMLPSTFVPLNNLPLTLNGKVDRMALASLEVHRQHLQPAETSGGPLSSTELRIAQIWQQALGVEHVNAHDTFLDLGGHSLLAMQVVARIQRVLNIRLKPRELMFHSLRQVALTCEERQPLSQPRKRARWIRKACGAFATSFSRVLTGILRR